MEREEVYRVYYKDKRNGDKLLASESYETLDKAKQIFNALSKYDDITERHIKREIMIKEIIITE